ncbi:hypothetical protein M501DRAFT_748215 [Patellaria atrata CBS 101060]|uniref:Uncharacterized protein n=1 Tax=Patellaria atrata CBS 101060 TaxID=1346257 RepID=A0A9P4SDV8_9PEZI|nr:hypothetical protein M501DRAFT_748215 [Patellaria atrata CBS 101060]
MLLTKTLSLLLLPSLGLGYAIQCYTDENCTGGAGAVREVPSNSNICISTSGRKSCKVHGGNGIIMRVVGGNQCGAYDVGLGCATGGGCINLMHPFGNYYPYHRVDISSPTLCWAGRKFKFT